MTDEETQKAIDEVRSRPWTASFHKTLVNHGMKVDLYQLLDDDSGEQLIYLSVPHGEFGCAVANYVAESCRNPWFARMRPYGQTDIAVAFNRALAPFKDKDGMIDTREVFVAAIAVLDGYLGALPKRSRIELIESAIAQLMDIRRRP
jgi:hypothetical protein